MFWKKNLPFPEEFFRGGGEKYVACFLTFILCIYFFYSASYQKHPHLKCCSACRVPPHQISLDFQGKNHSLITCLKRIQIFPVNLFSEMRQNFKYLIKILWIYGAHWIHLSGKTNFFICNPKQQNKRNPLSRERDEFFVSIFKYFLFTYRLQKQGKVHDIFYLHNILACGESNGVQFFSYIKKATGFYFAPCMEI